MKPRWEETPAAEATRLPPAQRRKKRKNELAFDVRAAIIRLTGVDLAVVDGLGPNLAQIILSEIGTDMSKWATDKQFTAWLGLAPRNDISGGKVLRSHVLPSRNRAGQAFRQAATAVARSSSAFGAYYRRKRAQGGPMFAQVATAHKIARTVYHLLKYRVQYVDLGAEEFARKQREGDVVVLRKKAAKLALCLSPPKWFKMPLESRSLACSCGFSTEENHFHRAVSQKKLPASSKVKRTMIETNHPQLSVRRQCELVGLSRATFYRQPSGETPFNLRLMRLIDEEYTRTPFYGYRKMTARLNLQGHTVNRKRVARLMRTDGVASDLSGSTHLNIPSAA